MIERPSASSARARAETSNALSVPIVPIRAATTHGSTTSDHGQHLAEREPDVGRPLGQAAHVPRIPVLTVGDEGLDPIARLRQAELLVGPDAVQHLDLEPVARDPGRP